MADRDSMMSLEQLDPSPVEETPVNYQGDGYFPPKDDDSNTGKSTSSLGLSNHSTLWYLNKVQQYSTYLFSAFSTAHIANTSIIPLVTRSVPASESFLLLTRRTSCSMGSIPSAIRLTHTSILSRRPLRTSPHHRPCLRTRPLRPRHSALSTQPQF